MIYLSKIVSLTRWLMRLGLIGFMGVLVLISISNLGIFNPNWPFELFASFTRHVLFLTPMALISSFIFWRKSFFPLLAISIFCFIPFLTFSKYETPKFETCENQNCLTIVAANLRGRPNALTNLPAAHPEKDVDVVAIFELPDGTTDTDLKKLFPHHPHIILASHTPWRQPLGSIIAIVSKVPIVTSESIPIVSLSSEYWPRTYIRAEIQISDRKYATLYALHPRFPLSRTSMQQRGLMLDEVTQTIDETENFIIMGDLNLTPWTPDFRKLPGRRAGDPRITYTWDAERPWTGIPIDHIMVGENFTVIDAKSLNAIGSDHRPISAKIALK